MSLGPLPTIENRSYQTVDIVVYDGFVFEVTRVEDDNVELKCACDRTEFVPSTFISLL